MQRWLYASGIVALSVMNALGQTSSAQAPNSRVPAALAFMPPAGGVPAPAPSAGSHLRGQAPETDGQVFLMKTAGQPDRRLKVLSFTDYGNGESVADVQDINTGQVFMLPGKVVTLMQRYTPPAAASAPMPKPTPVAPTPRMVVESLPAPRQIPQPAPPASPPVAPPPTPRFIPPNTPSQPVVRAPMANPPVLPMPTPAAVPVPQTRPSSMVSPEQPSSGGLSWKAITEPVPVPSPTVRFRPMPPAQESNGVSNRQHIWRPVGETTSPPSATLPVREEQEQSEPVIRGATPDQEPAHRMPTTNRAWSPIPKTNTEAVEVPQVRGQSPSEPPALVAVPTTFAELSVPQSQPAKNLLPRMHPSVDPAQGNARPSAFEKTAVRHLEFRPNQPPKIFIERDEEPTSQAPSDEAVQQTSYENFQNQMQQEVRPYVTDIALALRPSVREYAVSALAEGRYCWRPEIKGYLAKVAISDPAPSVRAHCIRCLKKLGYNDPEYVSYLKSLAENGHEQVRTVASDALAVLLPR